MIKEAIEKIQELVEQRPTMLNVQGKDFLVGDNGYEEIYAAPILPEAQVLSSLDALAAMVKHEALRVNEDFWITVTESAMVGTEPYPLFIEVSDVDKVECFSAPLGVEKRQQRALLYVAKAKDIPGWPSEQTLPFERAMIALRTRFMSTVDSDYALNLLSQITTGAHVTYADNGIATSIVTKTGIDLQQNSMIRPIITLKPYRTFMEVDQPAGQFLIRISERGIAFIEADGGMWRLEARKIVKKWLEEALAEEIEAGKVVVML